VKIRPQVVSIIADEVSFQDESAVRAATVVWRLVSAPTTPGSTHERGISPARGLAFVGLPWQHTRGSALLGFVRHTAAWVAAQLSAQRHLPIEVPLVRPGR
jgi:putative flavoprotein involved in K+ transport